MRYALFLHHQEADDAGIDAEQLEQGQLAFQRYAADLGAAGVFVSTDILKPVAAATTITRRNGELEIQDGPFVDTKERLAGVFVIDVPDLDAAIAWAEKCPAAEWGSVEIRPSALTWSPETGWRTA